MRRQRVGYNQDKKVVVNDREYPITCDMYRVMKYFEESQAIQQTDTHYINCISNETWQKIILMLSEVNFNMQLPPPTIKNGNCQDYLQREIINHLQRAQHQQLNKIYKASHYLKINELRRAIGVFYACRIFFKQTKKDYGKKVQQLGLNRNDGWPNIEQQNTYKETFPFIN